MLPGGENVARNVILCIRAALEFQQDICRGFIDIFLNIVRAMQRDDREVHDVNVVVATANHYLRIASNRSRHSIGQSPVNPQNTPNWDDNPFEYKSHNSETKIISIISFPRGNNKYFVEVEFGIPALYICPQLSSVPSTILGTTA
jgi:hypothetical protein